MGVWTATVKDWADGTTPSAADFDSQLRDFANSFGAWSSYTPTLGGTGATIGNGTASGRYRRTQKDVEFAVVLTAGSTTNWGTGGLTLSTPVTGIGSMVYPVGGLLSTGSIYKLNGSLYTTTINLYNNATGALSAFVNTTYAAAASGHQLFIYGKYEAA